MRRRWCGTASLITRRDRRSGWRRAAMPAGDDLEAIQPAFDRAVEERRAPRWLQPDQLGEPRVAGEEVRGPAGEALLQRVAELRVERRERGVARRAARRTADWRSARRRRGRARGPATSASLDAARNGATPAVARLRRHLIERARDRCRSRRSTARSARGRTRSCARWRMRCHVGPSYHASFWKPNVRARPGARSAAISAASIAIVPLPHIGSSNGVPGVQPDSAISPPRDSRAAARRRSRAASRA